MLEKEPLYRSIVNFGCGEALVLGASNENIANLIALRLSLFHKQNTSTFSPAQILLIGYTNQSSLEIEAAIQQKNRVKDIPFSVIHLHKYCLKFLYENHLLNSKSYILNEFEALELIEYLSGNTISKDFSLHLMRLSSYLYALRQQFPKEIVDSLKTPHLNRTFLALKYLQYKIEHHLLDFNDILLQSFIALYRNKFANFFLGYKHIEVFEAHRMNLLEMEIIQLLRCNYDSSLVFYSTLPEEEFCLNKTSKYRFSLLKGLAKENIFYLSKYDNTAPSLAGFLHLYRHLEFHQKKGPIQSCLIEKHSDLPINPILYQAKTAKSENKYICSFIKQIQKHSPKASIALFFKSEKDAFSTSSYLRKKAFKHHYFYIDKLDFQRNKQLIYSVLSLCLLPKWEELFFVLRRLDRQNDYTYHRSLIEQMQELYLHPQDLFLEPKLTLLYRKSKSQPFVFFDFSSRISKWIMAKIDLEKRKVLDIQFFSKEELSENNTRFRKYIYNCVFYIHQKGKKLLEEILEKDALHSFFEEDFYLFPRTNNLYSKYQSIIEGFNNYYISEEDRTVSNICFICYLLDIYNSYKSQQEKFLNSPKILQLRKLFASFLLPLKGSFNPFINLYTQKEFIELLRKTYQYLIEKNELSQIDYFDDICIYISSLPINLYTSTGKFLQIFKHIQIKDLCIELEKKSYVDRIYLLPLSESRELRFDYVYICDISENEYSNTTYGDTLSEITPFHLYLSISSARKNFCVSYKRKLPPAFSSHPEIMAKFQNVYPKKYEFINLLKRIIFKFFYFYKKIKNATLKI